MSFIKPGGTTKKTIVNGIVTAVDGTPLPGISVGLKGVKQKAALSDACGNFAISISDDYIGVLLFGWANNTAGASLDLQLLPKSKAIIVALKAIATYENKNCTKSYKKSKKILI